MAGFATFLTSYSPFKAIFYADFSRICIPVIRAFLWVIYLVSTETQACVVLVIPFVLFSVIDTMSTFCSSALPIDYRENDYVQVWSRLISVKICCDYILLSPMTTCKIQ